MLHRQSYRGLLFLFPGGSNLPDAGIADTSRLNYPGEVLVLYDYEEKIITLMALGDDDDGRATTDFVLLILWFCWMLFLIFPSSPTVQSE